MSDSGIKVTDKRMFTPDGELREEYRHLGEGSRSEGAEEATPAADRPAAEVGEEAPRAAEGGGAPGRAPVEIPFPEDGLPAPTFFDLVALIAQPVALFLGDAKLPDGRSAEDLEAARLHIDLLEVVREKTVGNLTSQEMGFLENLLYQLRMRYVQKRG